MREQLPDAPPRLLAPLCRPRQGCSFRSSHTHLWQRYLGRGRVCGTVEAGRRALGGVASAWAALLRRLLMLLLLLLLRRQAVRAGLLLVRRRLLLLLLAIGAGIVASRPHRHGLARAVVVLPPARGHRCCCCTPPCLAGRLRCTSSLREWQSGGTVGRR